MTMTPEDAKKLQAWLGVTQDGVIGPQTLAALWQKIDARPTLGVKFPPEPRTDVPHFAEIAKHLEREEGRIPHAYQDHLGYWTIGIGRLIDKRKGGRLTDEEIDFLLANDIRRKMEALESHPGLKAAWEAVKDNPARATALLSMAFQMGPEGLAAFKNSLRLVAEKQWSAAASNMLQSLWARQTPERAERVTAMIETGKMA